VTKLIRALQDCGFVINDKISCVRKYPDASFDVVEIILWDVLVDEGCCVASGEVPHPVVQHYEPIAEDDACCPAWTTEFASIESFVKWSNKGGSK
jgi:hypothetical protein